MQNSNFKNVLIELITPLGKDAVNFIQLKGDETISGLFVLNIIFSANTKKIDPKQIIGKNITLSINMSDTTRYLNGIALTLTAMQNASGPVYQMQLFPSLALLNYQQNCRVFQNKSVRDIVESIFKEQGLKDYDTSKLRGTYKPIEYCVQYRETNLAFVSRLLASAGIFYYFKHEKGKHTLILADNKQAYIDNSKKVRLAGNDFIGLKEWQCNYQFFTGKWTYNDHDFTSPNKKLLASTDTVTSIGDNSNYEIYDYPGQYLDTGAGSQITKIRMEYEESHYCIARGSSNYINLNLAEKITFKDPAFPAEDGNSYVITSIEHEIHDYQNSEYADHQLYHNYLRCIPADTLFRPNQNFNKPAAPSTQLAIIVGPSGKEIYTDQYGRMKAQFIWDRQGKSDENSSCWMRAVQHWDGLLRIGTPVIISFIDDDIDRPIIIGPVYNANLMPLPNLTSEQTQSVLKRRYTDKSVEKKYNELRFEDKADNQLFSIYASKNMQTIVEQNFTQNVNKGNFTLTVKGGDVTIQTDGNITLDAKKSINITSGENITIKAKQNIKIDAGMSLQNSAGQKLSNKALEINNQADVKIASKAAMHNVEADGILTLKGGLVKEN